MAKGKKEEKKESKGKGGSKMAGKPCPHCGAKLDKNGKCPSCGRKY